MMIQLNAGEGSILGLNFQIIFSTQILLPPKIYTSRPYTLIPTMGLLPPTHPTQSLISHEFHTGDYEPMIYCNSLLVVVVR